MGDTVTAAAPSPRFFPGWIVVGAVFVMLMVSAGFGFYGLSVYLEALTREKGFATGPASFGTSVFFIVGGIAGRLLGPVIARIDVRIVAVLGAVVGGCALALAGQVTELWQLYLVYGLFAIGFAGTGILPGTTVVTRWFHAKRSVALSVASTGLSVGGLTVTKLASALIDDRGFAAATPWLGVAYVAVTVPVVVAFLWPDPAARGYGPDGARVAVGSAPPALTGVSYEVARASRFFVLITVGYVLAMGSQVGGIQQVFKLATERDARSTGELVVSVIAFASVMARLAGGLIAPRVPMGVFTAALAAVQGLSLLWLSQAGGRLMLLAAAALFGATVGNLLMLQPLLLAEAFGVREYPKIFGTSQLVSTIGVAGGPYLFGALHDAFDYATSYAVGGTLSMAGAVLIFLAGPVSRVHATLWPASAPATVVG
jgi:MFS family permease